MKFKFTLALIALLFCLKLSAQTTTVTPAHLKAAEDMLTASGADSLFKSNISTALNGISAQIPEDKKAAFIDVMNKFMTKYISWELMKDQLAVVYAQEFSEKELKDLTAFYHTPLGKKLCSKLPTLSQKGAKIGQLAVQNHQSELQKMIQDAFKGE